MNEKSTIGKEILGFTLIGLAGVGVGTIISDTYKFISKIVITRKIERCTKILEKCSEITKELES